MDATKVRQIRADVDAALKAVATKHGVDFTLGRLVYDSGSVRGKLTAVERKALVGGMQVTATPEAHELTKRAWTLGAKYVPGGTYYLGGSVGRGRIVGFKTTAKKYPWIVERASDGAKFKMPTFSVKQAVEAGAAK